MRIPVSAKVVCQDGIEGMLTLLVIDARSSRLETLVVETHPLEEDTLLQDRLLPIELMVPAEWLSGGDDGMLRINCTGAQMHACPKLRRMNQLSDPAAVRRLSTTHYESWAYYYVASLETEKVSLPSGDVWIDRKTGVITRDERRVGSVAGLEFDPNSRRLTGLILSKGFLWKREEVTLPITNVNRFEDDIVYINQAYQKVAHMPGIPVH